MTRGRGQSRQTAPDQALRAVNAEQVGRLDLGHDDWIGNGSRQLVALPASAWWVVWHKVRDSRANRLSLAGFVLLLVTLATGCGGPTPTPDVAQLADQYARQQSGGETQGCGAAAPGRESEENPGCIYSVTFAGCHDGYTGDQLSPATVEEEFPTEPGLQARYHRAVADCAARR